MAKLPPDVQAALKTRYQDLHQYAYRQLLASADAGPFTGTIGPIVLGATLAAVTAGAATELLAPAAAIGITAGGSAASLAPIAASVGVKLAASELAASSAPTRSGAPATLHAVDTASLVKQLTAMKRLTASGKIPAAARLMRPAAAPPPPSRASVLDLWPPVARAWLVRVRNQTPGQVNLLNLLSPATSRFGRLAANLL
jgi:hypothetical protein